MNQATPILVGGTEQARTIVGDSSGAYKPTKPAVNTPCEALVAFGKGR